MPFDGREIDFTRKEETHEVFSLDGLIAWLRGKPTHHPYSYSRDNNCMCLLETYFHEHGLAPTRVGIDDWDGAPGFNIRLPSGFDYVASGGAYYSAKERTYGDALSRALKLKEG